MVAVADIYRPNLLIAEHLARMANAGVVLSSPAEEPTDEQRTRILAATSVRRCDGYQEMLVADDIDAVLIASPPQTHKAMALDCLRAGKHVFCETPMATSIVDAREVVVAASRSDRIVQIGHQRRYHPNYNLVMKHLHDGYPVGRPVQIEAYHHENSHGRRGFTGGKDVTLEGRKQVGGKLDHIVNWRNYDEAGTGPCLEIIPRSLDTANWFSGGAPARVYASGGIEYWRDGRTAPDTLTVIFEYRMDPANPQFVRLGRRYAAQDEVALNSAYTLRVLFSYSLCNREHGVQERVIGDRATAVLNPAGDSVILLETMTGSPRELRHEHQRLLGSKLAEKLAAMTEAERRSFVLSHGDSYDLPGYFDGPRTTAPIVAEGSEESAEVHQFRAFADSIRRGNTPRANVMVGLAGVIAGECARRALAMGLPVDVDPAHMTFDFDTPPATGFDKAASPIPGTMEVL